MIAADLGRLFEVGFNTGVLAAIVHDADRVTYRHAHLHRADLRRLTFTAIRRRLLERQAFISVRDRDIVEAWLGYVLQKGFLCGLTFFREYLAALSIEAPRHKPEILYFQCNFCDDNSMGTVVKGKEKAALDLLSQLGCETVEVGRYSGRGEFLNADTLLLLRQGQTYRILCVDLSLFVVRSAESLLDLADPENLRRLLLRELQRLRLRSVFAGLSVDTQQLRLPFSQGLARYFTAFKHDDKESAKVIQAASYAESFRRFLEAQGLMPETAPLVVGAIGYTDRGLNALSVNRDTIGVLETCAQIYKAPASEVEIERARAEVLRVIRVNAAKSFSGGESFIGGLFNIAAAPDGLARVVHRERIDGFCSTADTVSPSIAEQLGLQVTEPLPLRDAHAALIDRALAGSDTYLFLTGNPGIGKTTAIVDYLKRHIDEGFLFLYVSPRKQVNLDVLAKFAGAEPGRLCHDALFTLTTNADVIRSHGLGRTVQYVSNTISGDFEEGTVRFVDGRVASGEAVRGPRRVRRTMEDLIQATKPNIRGVLDSLCTALSTVIGSGRSNAIVATASIQSLKKTGQGSDTLRHLETIFKGVYNERDGLVLPQKMRHLSGRLRHLFIMIDEITGDESGAEFLAGIGALVNRYELDEPVHGFNTKVIVADASIVDADVIREHLAHTATEPDKIFFRRGAAEAAATPLSCQALRFRGAPAAVINANSYPARHLDVTYKAFVETVPAGERPMGRYVLLAAVQEEIAGDIMAALRGPMEGQVIVYVQDKQRLADLIDRTRALHGGAFTKGRDYLEIHANISEDERAEIQTTKDGVRVVFMTASASRGLSFPRTTHILVDVPRFSIEQNLMEIIQVMYRGRGSFEEDGRHNTLEAQGKSVTFYLADRAAYNPAAPAGRALALRESLLDLLNVLIILKTAIMTRIAGSGTIGWGRFMMVPVGGKSVLAASDTLSTRVATLIRALAREYERDRSNTLLRNVCMELAELMGRVDMVLIRAGTSTAQGGRYRESFLTARPSFAARFIKAAGISFEKLLDFSSLEDGYVAGNLLIVPLAGKALQETYQMRLGYELRRCREGKLWGQMLAIRMNRRYPDSIRSAISDAIDLVDLLRQPGETTQRVEQSSVHSDQFYALPLYALCAPDVFVEYFAQPQDDSDADSFRDILFGFMRELYPIDGILPIADWYTEFPFVAFRSYSLSEARRIAFTDRYLLASTELNVLNVILSEEG